MNCSSNSLPQAQTQVSPAGKGLHTLTTPTSLNKSEDSWGMGGKASKWVPKGETSELTQ